MLHSQPTVTYQENSEGLKNVAADTYQRYAEIMRDVENLILDHSKRIRQHDTLEAESDFLTVRHHESNAPGKSKLKLLVPSVGTFFTKLHVEDAFKYQDDRRFISRRRFVAPSFNDIRLIFELRAATGPSPL